MKLDGPHNTGRSSRVRAGRTRCHVVMLSKPHRGAVGPGWYGDEGDGRQSRYLSRGDGVSLSRPCNISQDGGLRVYGRTARPSMVLFSLIALACVAQNGPASLTEREAFCLYRSFTLS